MPHMPRLDRKLSLYVAEEQQILREAYLSFFHSHAGITIAGASSDSDGASLSRAAATLKPDVLLLVIKVLLPATVHKLEAVRQASPSTAVVMLSACYDVKGIAELRKFSSGAGVGCAYLLKHTVDTVEQLTQVVQSVAEGRVILDQSVMEGLITTNEPKMTVLKDLSPRELEVLSWMSKGYRNGTIAEVLYLEPKTVERHINTIYSKLGEIPAGRDMRVHAVTLYLRGTGQMPLEDTEDEFVPLLAA